MDPTGIYKVPWAKLSLNRRPGVRAQSLQLRPINSQIGFWNQTMQLQVGSAQESAVCRDSFKIMGSAGFKQKQKSWHDSFFNCQHLLKYFNPNASTSKSLHHTSFHSLLCWLSTNWCYWSSLHQLQWQDTVSLQCLNTTEVWSYGVCVLTSLVMAWEGVENLMEEIRGAEKDQVLLPITKKAWLLSSAGPGLTPQRRVSCVSWWLPSPWSGNKATYVQMSQARPMEVNHRERW